MGNRNEALTMENILMLERALEKKKESSGIKTTQ